MGFGSGTAWISFAVDPLLFLVDIQPLILCLILPLVVGGAITEPWPAVRVFRSLDVVSCSVLAAVKAGSFEGGFKPEGRMFSSCDDGRSILAPEMRPKKVRVAK